MWGRGVAGQHVTWIRRKGRFLFPSLEVPVSVGLQEVRPEGCGPELAAKFGENCGEGCEASLALAHGPVRCWVPGRGGEGGGQAGVDVKK